ncbi:MAG TPA: histidine phosphatase family protein [Armatimonadota bacterium]|nr:histidine phosphatase family protein [Armatimonadota bacterium]
MMTADASAVFYLLRHGETAWNREEVFRGRADVPLNERGRAQAAAIADALAHQPLAAVYASPLQRALQTAQPVAAACGLEVQVDQRLTDLDFGDWEGVPLREAPERWPELFARWKREPGGVVFPGGEGLPVVRERAMAAIAEIAARHRGETAAVVSHRVVTKVALLAMLGLDESHFWRIRQDNGCLNRVERGDDGWVVVTINDRCHLRGLAADGARDF